MAECFARIVRAFEVVRHRGDHALYDWTERTERAAYGRRARSTVPPATADALLNEMAAVFEALKAAAAQLERRGIVKAPESRSANRDPAQASLDRNRPRRTSRRGRTRRVRPVCCVKAAPQLCDTTSPPPGLTRDAWVAVLDGACHGSGSGRTADVSSRSWCCPRRDCCRDPMNADARERAARRAHRAVRSTAGSGPHVARRVRPGRGELQPDSPRWPHAAPSVVLEAADLGDALEE